MGLERGFSRAEDWLHDAAAARTGLDDFGADYRPQLRLLLDHLDRAVLNEAGRCGMAETLIETLASRAHSEAGWKAAPESLAQPLMPPVLIAGLPRTGTTALHKLMAMDPQFQGLEFWLIDNPKPRPPRAAWESDPHYRAAVRKLRRQYDAVPDMMKAHEMVADEVYECLLLVRQCLVSVTFTTYADMPDYEAWALGRDMTGAYRRYADNLRLIGHREPHRRWLLKNPAGLFGMAGFMAAFPKARIIQTHRNPVQSVASGASLVTMARKSFSGVIDSAAAGAREVRLWAAGIAETMAARATAEHRFHDIDFREFNRRPLEVVAGIYAFLGLDLTAKTRRAMQAWLAANPPGKHGEHKYALEDFGLSEGGVREAFEGYVERFGL